MLPVEDVRRRLQRLIARPALPPGEEARRPLDLRAPAPLEAGPGADAVVWERWLVQSEPGPQGKVPVLLAHDGSAGRKPVVVVLHGTLKCKEDFADHLLRYAKQGYVAVSFDTRYRGERGSVKDYEESLVRAWRRNWSGPESEAPGEGDEHPFMYDSAWDLSRVIDMLQARPDVDSARIGATGVSLGGMHVWFGGAADTRIAVVAPSIGVQGYRYALQRKLWQPRVDTIRPVFEAAAADVNGPGGKITDEVVEKVWRRINPGILDELDAPSSLRLIAPRPLLVVNGEVDPRCPIEGVREAVEAAQGEWDRLGAPRGTLQLHVGKGVEHDVTPEMWHVIDDFLARHLTPRPSAQPRARL